MEIERKFTLRQLPERLEEYPKKSLEQGYLCTKPVLRIRKTVKNEKETFILCYKSTIGIQDENRGEDLSDLATTAKVNEEVELPLTAKAYETLLRKVEGRVISKTRYLIPYEGYTIELDVFSGELQGLIFAEVEFPDVKEANVFVPPAWFDCDVSNDKRYRNSFLATCRKEELEFNKDLNA